MVCFKLVYYVPQACCMESACMDKLTQLDKSVTELRLRAERLARREAERVELLERAEAAWKDLELGYQRRLLMAEEKEDDMAKNVAFTFYIIIITPYQPLVHYAAFI